MRFYLEQLREVLGDLHRLGMERPRLYRGVVALLCLLVLLSVWKGGRFLIDVVSRRGVAVEGFVTFAGDPLDRGLISFHEVSVAGDDKPLAGATIVGGRYRIPAPPGVRPGRYVVRIRSPQAGESDGTTTPPAEERIPAAWNDRSSVIIEVRRFGWNTFNFAIPN
jgi:hypothetical protein